MEENKKSKWRFSIYLLWMLELGFLLFNSVVTCMCGHHMFKIIPTTVAFLGEIIHYINIVKKESNKLTDSKYVKNLFIKYFIIFVAVAILSKNNMKKLHSIN